MTSVRRCDAGHGAVTAVGIARISPIGILGYDIEILDTGSATEVEAALAMCHPDAQPRPGKSAEHHGIILGHGNAEILRLELMRAVMLHTRHTLACHRSNQAEFYHQLAAVTYAQRQGIAPRIEGFKRLPSLLVPTKARSPTLG